MYNFEGVSCRVLVVPRFLFKPAYWLLQQLGIPRVLWLARFLPSNRGLGYTCYGKEGVHFDSDRRHCLLLRPDWQHISITRALTEFQRLHWHGYSFPLTGAHDASPPQS